VTLAGVVDAAMDRPRYVGLPVVAALDDLPRVDAVMVCSVREPQKTFDALAAAMPSERVLTPPLLRISRTKPTLAESEQ
jgi:hypothetical protein